jgi:predicted PurR-regulated permease PerM
VSTDAERDEQDDAAQALGPDDETGREIHRRRLAIRRARDRARDQAGNQEHDSITQRLATQWSQLREVRRSEPVPVVIEAGPSNFSRAQVPWGLDLAAAWGWRLLIIGAAGYGILWLVAFFSVVTLPVAIALLVAALVSPAVSALTRAGLPRGLAAILMVITALAVLAALLTFAGQQVANGAQDLADSTVDGLEEIRAWLKDGPLNASDSQINDYIQSAQDAIQNQSGEGGAVRQATEITSTIGHLFAGFFIILFSTYFFLADGERIWAWIVRLAPRAARERVDASGRVAWISLTQFVRATVIVAVVDAIGVMIVAAVLGVPFVLALGVLVFIGAFVPLVGATVAGSVAVLVALVDQGPLTALLMLGGVILVQQIEGHILQPFLMGRWVSLHPLGVILALATGVVVGGVAGALVAVPLAAAGNAVVQHLAGNTTPGDDPVEELAEDYEEIGARGPVEEELAEEPRDD